MDQPGCNPQKSLCNIPVPSIPNHFPISAPSDQPMYIPQAVAQPAIISRVGNEYNTDVVIGVPVQTSINETSQGFQFMPTSIIRCKYCRQIWNPMVINKLTACDVILGTILVFFFLIPGLLYCWCRRIPRDCCSNCRKCVDDENYCCEC